jgi:hypothetical protein
MSGDGSSAICKNASGLAVVAGCAVSAGVVSP